jgi:hypothetical protein
MGAPLETSHDRAAITRALERLQHDGTLTRTQVEAVLGELDQVLSSVAPGAPPGGTRGNRFAEAAAYAGAVLVAASGVLLVVQQWNDLTRLGRVAVLAVITLLLGAAGLLLVTARPRGRTALLDPRRSVRRRAAATVLTAAAVTAAGTGLLLVPDHALLTAGLIAVAVILPSTAAAPSAVSETAALGAVLLLIAGVFEEADPSLAVAIPVLAAAGVGWALLSTTGLVTLPRLALTLGLAVTLWSCAAGAFSGEQPATPSR